jgi:hypothetical protein
MSSKLSSHLERLGFQSPDGLNPEKLKKRYQDLVKIYHPDKGGEEKVFIAVRESYIFVRDFLENPTIDFNEDTSNESNITEEITQLHIYIESLKTHIQDYEAMINSQISAISRLKPELEDAHEMYVKSLETLKVWYSSEKQKLQKQYEKSWMDLLVGRQKMTKAEYIAYHNSLTETYNAEILKSEQKYSDKIIEIYQHLIGEVVGTYSK